MRLRVRFAMAALPVLATVLVWLIFLTPPPRPASAAIPGLPGDANIIAGRFPTNPSAVTVDVVEIGGSQLANNVSATRVSIDGANSDVWYINLASVTGYAPTCTPKRYVVRFQPDSANCASANDPELCYEEIVESGGALCKQNPRVQVSYEFALVPFPTQGISANVISTINRRQASFPIRWRRIDVANDLGFSSPDSTLWEVYFYSEANGHVHLKCTVNTEADPSISLPSSSACTGQ